MSETPISIIIPAFNQLEYCRQCVYSVRANTERAHRLILVDNGSTDGVSEFFDAVPEAVVVHAPENRGFAGGVNLGLDHAEGHVLLLNSDTLVPPGWLARLETALLRHSNVGIIGPVSNCAAGAQQVPGPASAELQAITAYAEELAGTKAGAAREATRLVGFCMMIREAAWQRVGLFDERFGIGNFEDDDYCTRVRRAGWKLAVAEDTFVYHHGGRTFAGMGIEGEKFDALMAENRARYADKWQVHMPGPLSAEDRAARLNAEGRAALAAGSVAESVRLLKEAVAAAPDVARHYNDLGAALWRAERFEMAYKLFQEALRRAPDDPEVRENVREAAASLGLSGQPGEQPKGDGNA